MDVRPTTWNRGLLAAHVRSICFSSTCSFCVLYAVMSWAIRFLAGAWLMSVGLLFLFGARFLFAPQALPFHKYPVSTILRQPIATLSPSWEVQLFVEAGCRRRRPGLTWCPSVPMLLLNSCVDVLVWFCREPGGPAGTYGATQLSNINHRRALQPAIPDTV